MRIVTRPPLHLLHVLDGHTRALAVAGGPQYQIFLNFSSILRATRFVLQNIQLIQRHSMIFSSSNQIRAHRLKQTAKFFTTFISRPLEVHHLIIPITCFSSSNSIKLHNPGRHYTPFCIYTMSPGHVNPPRHGISLLPPLFDTTLTTSRRNYWTRWENEGSRRTSRPGAFIFACLSDAGPGQRPYNRSLALKQTG